MVDRYAIEGALQRGQVWAAMRNGRYWKLRRNGATKLWKTRPDEFRIPVKAGLKSCGELTQTSRIAFLCDDGWRNADFVITDSDPNEVA